MFQHGKLTRVLVDAFDLTAFFTKSGTNSAQELLDATTFGNDYKVWFPGYKTGDVSLEGLFSSTNILGTPQPGNPQAVLDAAFNNPVCLLSIAPRKFTIGNEVFLLAADVKDYKISSAVNALTMISANLQSTNSIMQSGVSLHDIAATEAASTDSAAVDNGASSALGAIAFLHIVQYASLTNATIKIQHSTDNVTFIDAATFTVATGVTSEQKSIAGTLNRYVRARSTLAGSGTITYAVGFARGA